MRDPYEILNVPKTATEADVKKAFRRLAKQYHPDRNSSDPKAKDKFNEANAAHEILGDPEKRGQFDRGEIDADGKPRFQGGFGGGGPGGSGGAGFEGFSFGFGRGARGGAGPAGAEDIFSHLFGEGGRTARARPSRGDDVSATLSVAIEDLVRETKQRIALPGGREVEVTMPPEVADGQVIRLRGLGRPGGAGAEAGDVLLTVRIAPQDRYQIDGADLRMRCPVDLDDAILGGKVRVATPTGAIEMTVPAMTSSGRTFRLRGKGLPGKAGRGDLLVVVEIRLPESPDEALDEAAKRLRATRVA